MAPPIICDTGTGNIKAGFAGDQEPSLIFPSILGRPILRHDAALGAGMTVKDLEIGHDAIAKRAMLELTHPIKNGLINDWSDMEAIWDHTFEGLGVSPASFGDQKIVLTEAALNDKKKREKMTEIMFEKYGFAAINISVQAILALTSQGLKTGFVVDSGDGVTHLVPVFEGYLQPTLIRRVNLAGRHVTDYLMKLLVGAGHPLNSSADFETVREIKEKLCYCAHDLQAERRLARDTTVVDRNYTLPDSRTLKIGAERFLAPEILFTPSLLGQADHEGGGLADMVFDTIRKSDMSVQKDYYAHIIMSGGTTMFPGCSSRMEKDLTKLYLDNVLKGDTSRLKKFKCHVEDPPRRNHMVFHGASILADIYAQQDNHPWWVTKAEYDEKGPGAAHRLIMTSLS